MAVAGSKGCSFPGVGDALLVIMLLTDVVWGITQGPLTVFRQESLKCLTQKSGQLSHALPSACCRQHSYLQTL